MKNKTITQGLGNKKIIYCHFKSMHQCMTHSNIEDYKSHVNIQYYVNQSESLSYHFQETDKVSPKSADTMHDTAVGCRKLHKQLSNSCRRGGKGDA